MFTTGAVIPSAMSPLILLVLLISIFFSTIITILSLILSATLRRRYVMFVSLTSIFALNMKGESIANCQGDQYWASIVAAFGLPT